MTRRKTRATGNNETQSNVAEASKSDGKTEGKNDMAASGVTAKEAEPSENITAPENTSLNMSQNEGNVESESVTNVTTPSNSEDSENEDTNLADKDSDSLPPVSQEVADPAKKRKKKRKRRRKSTANVSKTDASDSAEREKHKDTPEILQNTDMQRLLQEKIVEIESGKIKQSSLVYSGGAKIKNLKTGKEEFTDLLITKEVIRVNPEVVSSAEKVKKGKKLKKSVQGTSEKESPTSTEYKEHKLDNSFTHFDKDVDYRESFRIPVSNTKSRKSSYSLPSTEYKEYKLDISATYFDKDVDYRESFRNPVSATKSGKSSYKVKQKIDTEEETEKSTEDQLNLSDNEIKTKVSIRPVIFVQDKLTQTDPIEESSNIPLPIHKRNNSKLNLDSDSTVGANAASSELVLPLTKPNQEHSNIPKPTFTENKAAMNSDSTANAEASVSDFLLDPEELILENTSEDSNVQDLFDSNLSSLDTVLQEPSNITLPIHKRNNSKLNLDSDSTVGAKTASSELVLPLAKPNQEHSNIPKPTFTENNAAMNSDSTAKAEASVSNFLLDPEKLILENTSEDSNVQDLFDSNLSSLDPVLQSNRDDFLRNFETVNEMFKKDFINCFKNEK